MRFARFVQARLVQTVAYLLPLLISGTALAVTDRRAVDGAAADVGPAIPEPTSILLFALGVGVVGYGVHRRQRNSR